jgi:hypothetical protein
MADFFDNITEKFQDFIKAQQMFFVATAPLGSTGRINLSPKGLNTFQILSNRRVAYLDLTGSGNETSSHLYENGRITFMFCAFEDPPLILRLYGRGQTILPGSSEWNTLLPLFPELPGVRQIIAADIESVQASCGWGVPIYQWKGQREKLVHWAAKRGNQGVQKYRLKHNTRSIDGLPTPLGQAGGNP